MIHLTVSLLGVAEYLGRSQGAGSLSFADDKWMFPVLQKCPYLLLFVRRMFCTFAPTFD